MFTIMFATVVTDDRGNNQRKIGEKVHGSWSWELELTTKMRKFPNTVTST
jgi:hypothetical protein